MTQQPLHIIVNPASGSSDPALGYMNKVFKEASIPWKAYVLTGDEETATLAKELTGKGIVVAYGGDGTVMEVARGLYGSDTPMAILPGGTANVMAKELGIPMDMHAAIDQLAGGTLRPQKIDMGLVNDQPFLIRINLGILSDMITEASPELKDRWGQWAYGISAFQTMQQEPTLYELTIDGETFKKEAVALTVTNAGNIGRQGYSFLPDISVTDGLLDVIMLDRADLLSVLKVTGSMLLQKDTGMLQHWKAKEIFIRTLDEASYLCDDCADKARELHIKVVPGALSVLAPPKD
jgi:diacylglycerol kinase (ATP)